MAVTALCVQMLINVFFTLAAPVDVDDFTRKTAFLHIDPNRLQFFEYESVSIHCGGGEGSTEWKVMRKLHKMIPLNSSNTCDTPAAGCTFNPIYAKDSGLYWCENEGGETSGAVNITVTAGSVILELPVHPVMEGDNVTLHCMKKKSESKHIVDFYKDGVLLKTLYYSNMTLHKVSRSDEGLYKCRISGAGESPERWLAVLTQSEEEVPPSDNQTSSFPVHLWIIVLGALLASLLLLLGLCQCWKNKDNSDAELNQAVYAVVNRQHKNTAADEVTYATVNYTKRKEPRGKAKAHAQEEPIYSRIKQAADR